MIAVNVQKWKLWYSNPFHNASMPNERISSNFGQVVAQFSFLPHFNSKTTEPIFTIFTRSRAISGAINACIRRTIVHFISEHESKEWRRLILKLAKIAKIYWLP